MDASRKKTPSDATDFEREQLRFFLSQENVGERLAELNPSLSWLPELARMKLVQSFAQFAPWIEKNFDDYDAIREVVANLGYFDETAADILEYRLHRVTPPLTPLLSKSWQLIIRHIRENPRAGLRGEWFEIRPRIKAGENSFDLIHRIAQVLRPRPQVGKRISWYDETEAQVAPQRPTDLMSLDYEVEDGVTDSDFLTTWREDTSAEIDSRLITALADALDLALADAVENEVESNSGYGISDTDVPSVAAHSQNQYRTGFLPIVRVIAEVWSRAALKSPALALPFVSRWSSSPMKLNNRLALFASANNVVPPESAAKVLLGLPQGLLFLTNSSVEVFRLIHHRWSDFSVGTRQKIEVKLRAGPPSAWFSSDATRHIDRSRFDVLGEMDRRGLALGATSKRLLSRLKKKYPLWELRPAEQAGFHIWSGSSYDVANNSENLEKVPADLLLHTARQLAENADFMEGDAWQALCTTSPQHALSGLAAGAAKGEWPTWGWRPFLWAAKKIDDATANREIADLLLKIPTGDFSEITDAASWWLSEKADALDDQTLWSLWDKIEESAADLTQGHENA
jgi:hypothetical protein